MKWLATIFFAVVLLGHFAYATWSPSTAASSGPWASFEFTGSEQSRVERYAESGDFWHGLSYGVAGAFAAWCFARVLKLRRAAAATSTGGITLSGVLIAGVCFLTGCCGSPMLPIYLGLFGPQFISVTKPLTFGITIVSIVIGYVWMMKRTPEAFEEHVNNRLHENAGAEPGQV